MDLEQQEIMTRIGRAHLSYFGHIERRKGECLEKIILEGAVEGVRKRGRPAKRWMDNIKKMSECSGAEAKNEALDRSRWRKRVWDLKIQN